MVYVWYTKMTQKFENDWKCLILFIIFWCMQGIQKTGIYEPLWGFIIIPPVCVIPKLWEATIYVWYAASMVYVYQIFVVVV